jgi:NADH-quinone oxidoreductase subunit J
MEALLTTALFWIFSLGLGLSAISVVVQRNPVASALSLVVVMGCAAALMIQLGAFFLGVMQVLVYAGAVMVLFLFIIMLLDVRAERMRKPNWLAILSGLIFFGGFIGLLFGRILKEHSLWSVAPVRLAEAGDDVRRLGVELFTYHLLAFEATAVLLVVAIVGVILLCMRKDSRTSAQPDVKGTGT